MSLDQRIREAEALLFARYGLEVDESFVELSASKVRLRVLSVGSGPDLVLLHGVGLAAAIWVPWLSQFTAYRAHLVELPGHGFSDPVTYQVGAVRPHAVTLLNDLFDALDLDSPSVIGHSLAGMFALWHAAARPGRIGSLVAIGDPAVALPGVRVKMPLSLMTVRGLGPAVLSSPLPRAAYRALLGQGLSRAAVVAMPDELVETLHLAGRKRDNAHTVASLMHAINRFRRPRPESVMSDHELGQIDVPTLFCWGKDDRYLSPERAHPAVAKISGSTLRQVAGGHAPWFEDPIGCAASVKDHLRANG
jgi:pimeloyl-ACP methyl ester carboxylesterase